MTLRRPALLAAIGATALALAACSSEPPPPPSNDDVPAGEIVDEGNVTNTLPEVEPAPAPEPAPANDAAIAKAVETQMYEDADAVGMTARVDRSGGETKAPAEEPAEDAKQ